MPKYTFVTEGTISLSVTVEAEDLESAVEKAQDAPIMSLCHQCAHGEDGEWVPSGELGCDPTAGPLIEVWEDDENIPASDVEWWG